MKKLNLYKSLFALFFLLAGILVACSDEGSSVKGSGDEESANEKELTIIDSILGLSKTFSVQFLSFDSYAGQWYEDTPWHLESDSTIDLRDYTRDIRIKISFADTTKCNYQNTRVLVDGKELRCDRGDMDDLLCLNFIASLTETHELEILLDSANCGNLKKRLTIVPSKEPGKVYTPSIQCYHPSCPNAALNNFFVEVGPLAFVERVYYWEIDTLQSRCYLKHGSDSLDLNMEYEKDYDFWNANHYRRAVASADSAALANLMQGDTVATIHCAVIYQSWYVHQPIDTLQFTEMELNIQSYQKKRLISAAFSDDGALELRSADCFHKNIYTRANVNGTHKYHYERVFTCTGNSEVGYYYRVLPDSIYGDYASTEKDSVQIIVMDDIVLPSSAGASIEENDLRVTLNELPYIDPDDVFVKGFNDSTAAVLDSIIEVVTDESGNIKPKYFFIDAKRVPGYKK